jgi:rSAM/selenodomain-associated transferase 1
MSVPKRPRLLVFARVPVPGRVKTRLIGPLGEQGAAAVLRVLLWRTLEATEGLAEVERELWWDGTPAPGGSAAGLAAAFGMTERVQQGADLGERMARALAQTLAGAPAAILIGSDCADCDGAYLRSAFVSLEQADAVLGPARDGVDVLIGLRRLDPNLLTGLPWGSDQVLALTRAPIQALGWRWHELPSRRDIDRPDDLAGFPELLAAARGEQVMP